MTKVVVAVDELELTPEDCTLFLAGGITNCPDWQSEISTMLDALLTYKSVTVLNPRRIGDLAKNGKDAEAQIWWEHKYLNPFWVRSWGCLFHP